MSGDIGVIENLIVIAAHGDEYIHRCLEPIVNQYPTIVIDTFSDAPIKCNADTYRLPFKGHATGAYLWAYWHYPAKNYFFMHDSMEVIDEDFLQTFIDLQPERGAVGWTNFDFNMDDDAQSKYIQYCYESRPQYGIFGPIFYTNRASLDELRDKKLLPPTPMNKNHDMACERMWPMAFAQAGMEVKFAEMDYIKRVVNGDSLLFKKILADRK